MRKIPNLTILKQPQQRDQLLAQTQQTYKKLSIYFYYTLPKTFNLTNNLIYGQCKIQILPKMQYNSDNKVHEQVQALILQENDRKICRYIANNQQILLLQISNNMQLKNFTNNYHCIRYKSILQIKLGNYYGDIMLLYKSHGNDQQLGGVKYVKSMIIEVIDLGLQKQNQLRSHLQRYCIPHGTQNIKIINYQCTLLNYSHLTINEVIAGNKKDEDKQKSPNRTKIISSREIKGTRIINIRKMKEQIINQIIRKDQGQIKLNKNQINSSIDIYKVYSFYTDNISKRLTKIPQAQFYIVSKSISKNTSDNKKLFTLKITPLQKIKNNQQLIYSIYTESKIYKHQEVITPYIPVLNRVQYMRDLLVMQYEHFEGFTLRELLIKDKINIQKRYMKQLTAQIVMGIGHIHQCGFMYTVDIDNIIINYDGHILFNDIGSLTRIKNHRYHNQIVQKQEQGSNSKKQSIKLLSDDIKKKPKDFNKKSPQEFLQPKKQKFSWDWWALGLLLYEIVQKSDYFEIKTNMQVFYLLTNNNNDLNMESIQKKLKKQVQLLNLIKNLLKKDQKQRLGHKNDYHSILEHQYFKQLDKKKLTKRQGDGIMKIKQIKLDEKGKKMEQNKRQQNLINKNRIKKGFNFQTQMKQLNEVNKNWQELLNQCIYDLDIDYSDA